MRKHGLHLDRRQSTDQEFSRKASEIVGLSLAHPRSLSKKIFIDRFSSCSVRGPQS
jgi:hypothetical protein